MPKDFQKYFIAVVPGGHFQEHVTGLKMSLKDQFNLKYALKSPAHITLKMPFSWSEAKESRLISQLKLFFSEQVNFRLKLSQIGNFGTRVIFVKVQGEDELAELQKKLSLMCKLKLNLKIELSDKAFYPHMTLAYRDVKGAHFEAYLQYLKPMVQPFTMDVKEVALLKREDGKWKVCQQFALTENRDKLDRL